MKKHIFRAIIISAFCLMGTTASAQLLSSNDLLYHSFRSTVSNQLNPALFPSDSKWFVALPKADLSLALPLSYKDLGLKYDPSTDTTYLNINDLLKTLENQGSSMLFNTDVDILRVGFTIAHRFHFTLSAGTSINSTITIPTEVTRLVTEGNLGPNGEPQTISLGCDRSSVARAYAYTSIGASYDLASQPLTVGARLNVLYGLLFASVDNITIDLATSDDYSTMTLTTDYLAHTAGWLGFSLDEQNKTTTEFTPGFPKSTGFTFDLGAQYSYAGFDVSASILNIGPGIHWKENTTTLTPENPGSKISFEGIDLSAILSRGTIDTASLSRILDSVADNITPTTEDADFWYTVPSRIYLGASYSVNTMLRLGYLLHGEWDCGLFSRNSTFRCNNTLSASFNLFDWIEVTAANSFSYDGFKADFFNPGVALSINPGRVFQIYLGLDYASSIYATDIKSVRCFFGISIVGKSKN